MVTLVDGVVVIVLKVYLWQGSGKCQVDRAEGDSLPQAILDDLAARTNPLPLIVEHVNAQATAYSALRLPLRAGRLIDFGADAPIFSPPGATLGSRRDLCLATAVLQPRVVHLAAGQTASVYVHTRRRSSSALALLRILGWIPRFRPQRTSSDLEG